MRPPRVSRAWKRVSKKSLCRTMMPSLVDADALPPVRARLRYNIILIIYTYVAAAHAEESRTVFGRRNLCPLPPPSPLTAGRRSDVRRRCAGAYEDIVKLRFIENRTKRS